MSALRRLLVFAGTFALSYYVFFEIFKQNHLIAIIIMGSIFLHEFGHWLGFLLNGVWANMFFIPPLGAAVSPIDVDKAKKLSFHSQAWVVLAGVMMNLLLVCYGFYQSLVQPSIYWDILISLNGMLILFNLIPAFIFDGGHYFSLLMRSMEEHEEHFPKAVTYIIAVVILVGVLVKGSYIWMPALIVYGALNASQKDDPNDAFGEHAMTNFQERFTFFVYVALLLFGAAVTFTYPTFYELFKSLG